VVGRGRGSVVGRFGGGYIGLGLWVYWGSLIGDLCHISIDMVSSVLDSLDPTIRERHLVGTRNNTVSISGLGRIEVRLGVVISNTIGVGVGLGDLFLVRRFGVVNRFMDNRGVDNRGRDNGGVNNGGGMVGSRGGMVDRFRVVGRFWVVVGRGRVVGWLGMVGRSRMVGGLRMVGRGSMVGRSSVMDSMVNSVVGDVGAVGYHSTVTVGNYMGGYQGGGNSTG